MSSYSRDQLEFKVRDDEGGLEIGRTGRIDKDDKKMQAKEARMHTKQHSSIIEEVHAGELPSQRNIHHTSMADLPFSSIPDDAAAAPSKLSEMEASTGAAIDTAVEKAKDGIIKAKSLLWKDGDASSTDAAASSTSDPSMSDKAKTMFEEDIKPKLDDLSAKAHSVYEQSVLPQIELVGKKYAEQTEKASEQLHILREEGWQATEGGKMLNRKLGKSTTDKSADITDAKPADTRRNAYLDARMKQREPSLMDKIKLQSHRMMDKAVEIWEGEEPLVRSYMHQAVQLIKRYGLEIPLMALATLLVLWASVSLVTYMAFPAHSEPANLPVLYQPELHIHDAPITPDIQPAESGLGDKLSANLDTIRASGADTLRDIKSRMPSMPSMDNAPSMDDIKLRATDAAGHLKDGIANIMPSTTEHSDDSAKSGSASTLRNIGAKIVDAKNGLMDRVQDRAHHVIDAMPSAPSIHGVKNMMGDIKGRIIDRLSPDSAQHIDAAGADVFDPENHVVEEMHHGHVEEHVQL